jgi:hypothetical protein
LNNPLVNKINDIFFDELRASQIDEQLIIELRNRIDDCEDLDSLQAIIEKYVLE